MSMVTTLKGTNVELTGEVKSYLDAKVASFSKFVDPNDPAHRLDVELGRITDHHRSGNVFKAELTLTKGGKQYRATGVAETLHAAIDAVEDQMTMELGKAKQKERGFVRRSGAKMKELMRDWRNWKF